MKKYFPLILIPVIVAVLLGGCAATGAGGGAGGAGDATDPLANIPEVNFAGFDTVSPSSVSTLGAHVGENAVDQYETVNNLDDSIIVVLTNTVADAIEAHVAAGGDPEQVFTFENIINRPDGAVHKQFFTIRLEDDTNGYVFRGFNDQVNYDDKGVWQKESSWEDARVELAFGPGFDSARFALRMLDENGDAINQEGVEYIYETQSGKLLGHWVYGEDSNGDPLYNTSYESIDNDGSITYRGFQDDDTPTVVMKQNSDGIGYLHEPKDGSSTTYSLLDHDGTDTDTEPTDTFKSELDTIVLNLTATFAQAELDSFLASANLDAPSYEDILPIHQDYTPSWE